MRIILALIFLSSCATQPEYNYNEFEDEDLQTVLKDKRMKK